MHSSAAPRPILIAMGSQSDWPTMRRSAEILDAFTIEYDSKIVSAHRTPDRLFTTAKSARELGYRIIIAGAGGAAHLPGMMAAMTTLPVLGVPIETRSLSGLDSLYSIVQMPAGIPVATLAIGTAGAANAALLAIAILAINDRALADRLEAYRQQQSAKIAETPVLEPGQPDNRP